MSQDQQTFAQLVAALAVTGEFSTVSYGPPTREPMSSQAMPSAIFTPDTWTETDDYDPISLLRIVTYRLTLTVRDEDQAARFDALDQLGAIAANKLDGSTFNNTALAALSFCRSGRFDPTTKHPESSLILSGQFAALVPGFGAHLE